MPNETEVIQADVFVEFELPNGAKLRGKPVPYPAARKIMALLHAFDKTGDYDKDMVPALNQFSELTGLTDEAIMAADPNTTLGELLRAIQRFFFRRRPTPENGAAKTEAPVSTKPRPGEPGA